MALSVSIRSDPEHAVDNFETDSDFQNLMILVNRITTDLPFRQKFMSDAPGAITSSGVVLSASAQAALLANQEKALELLSRNGPSAMDMPLQTGSSFFFFFAAAATARSRGPGE